MLALLKTNGQFRLLLIYQIFSSLGNGVYALFMLLSVHLTYGNTFYTGIAAFLMSAPHVLSFVVGPVVDRGKKVTIMRITTLLEFGAIALLTFSPFLESFGVLFMFAIIIVMSSAALFEGPSGSALLPQIVDDKDILAANQLINITATVGGILLGVLLITALSDGDADSIQLIFSISTGFLVLAFLFSLLLRNPDVKTSDSARTVKGYVADLLAGMKFLRNNVLLFFLIGNVTLMLVGSAVNVSRPAFLEYHAGAQGYIIFTVISMVGYVIASVLIGPLSKVFKIGSLILIAYIIVGALRIIFVFVLPNSFYAALGLTIVIAAAMSVTDVIDSTLGQKIPPKDMVARVGTLNTTFGAIAVALGALAGAFIGNAVADPAHIFIAQGVICALIGLYYILVPSVRKLPKMGDITREEEEVADAE